MIAIARAEPGTSRRVQLRSIAIREARLREIWLDILQSWSRVVTVEELRRAARFGAVDLSVLSSAMGLEARRRTDQLVEAITLERIQRDELEEFLTPLGPVTVETLAREQIGQRVVELEAGALKTLRAQLVVVMREGPTDDILAAIAQTTGLTTRQTMAVANLQRRLIEQGVGATQASSQAAAYARRSLRRRARLIARTEAVDFTARIVEERGLQVGNMSKQWVSARDGGVEEICTSLDNGQKVPVGQMFSGLSGSIGRPTAHPGCRCVLELSRAKPRRGTRRPRSTRVRRPRAPPPPVPRAPPPKATGDARSAAQVGAELEEAGRAEAASIARFRQELEELNVKARPIRDKMEKNGLARRKIRTDAGLDVYFGDATAELRQTAAWKSNAAELVALETQLSEVNARTFLLTERLAKLDARNRLKFRSIVERAPADYNRMKVQGTALQKKRHAEGLAGFRRLVHARWADGRLVRIQATQRNRSFQKGSAINMNRHAAPSSTVHELGHILEEFVDEILKASQAVFERRTAGEAFVRLSQLRPGVGYGAQELTKKDAWIDPYVGRTYSAAVYGSDGTEVLTMGLEYMYRNPLEFWRKDSDHFTYIWDIMRGVIP